MSVTVICAAIQGRNQISFQYSLGSDPGPRLVEPYMVAYNRAGHLTLSAWFLDGNSESQERQSWRKYLLSGISNVTVLRHSSLRRVRVTIRAVGGRFTVFNALCNLFRRCILNSFYGSSPQTWLEHKKAGGRIPSFSAFANCPKSSFAGSHHSQNPPFDRSDLSLLWRQRWIEVAVK